MKITNIKKTKKNIYCITLDNHQEYLLFEDVVIKNVLLPKKNLTETELQKVIEQNKKLEAYYEALQYLNKKNRTSKEIKEYLQKKDYTILDINEAIDRITKEGYLNELQYIESYLNDAYRFTSDGPIKIKKKLLERGLNENNIEEVLKKITQEEWMVKLNKIFQKKATSHHHDSIKKWAFKCEQYCYNLGYPREWIQEISSNYPWSEQEENIEREMEKLYTKWARKLKEEKLDNQIQRKLLEKGFSKEKIMEAISQRKEENK